MMLLPQEICWSNQRCPSPSWNWSIRFNPGKVTLFDFESGVLEFQFFWLQSWQVESACCFDHSSSRRSPVPLKTNFKLTNDTDNWIQLTCSVFVFLRHQPIDPLDNALHSSQKITFCCSRCEHVYILTIMWYIKLFSCFAYFLGHLKFSSWSGLTTLQDTFALHMPTNAKRRLQTFRIFS